MELTERETLVKVQEQLRSSVENQSQIVEDMREIFSRIDTESKLLAAVKGDLQTHLETSSMQQENILTRFNNLSRDSERLLVRIDAVASKQEESIKEIRTCLENEEQKREDLEKSFAVFQESVKSSVRSFKVTISIIATVMGLLTPYITLVLKDLLGK